MPVLEQVSALEILDSRGKPTLLATCVLTNGARAQASVPSGASTGKHEAVELRDGDKSRFRGSGCLKAVANVNGAINAALAGRAFETQRALDDLLIALDGTPNKARLGANALLAVSIAFTRAHALSDGVPLYHHFAALAQTEPRLPQPIINLFSGGKHAGGQIPVQDVLVVPRGAQTTSEVLARTYAVYMTAADKIAERYGMRLLRADEGGLAPPFDGVMAAFDGAMEAIQASGYSVELAVDVASSHFYEGGSYHLDGQALSGAQMVDQLLAWLAKYPILSIEDGLAEDDWEHWAAFKARLPAGILALGDDLLCTNPARIRLAIAQNAANALLLKVNQIGTLSEALDANQLARAAGWQVVVSARSGETEDNWLADLAVGWAADFIKIGSITQSERLAKYNRLLEIEAETGMRLG
jgi:enolase